MLAEAAGTFFKEFAMYKVSLFVRLEAKPGSA
jgi:hypothetical protein